MLPLLVLLVSPLSLCSDVAPDVTGLVGTPYMFDANAAAPPGRAPQPLPLKFWANPRDSALKPRRRDREPHRLMQLMGPDFEPRWMRRTRREDKLLNASSSSGVGTRSTEGPDDRRPSVLALWESALALQPPPSWPSPPASMLFLPAASLGSSASPAAWLVALASCPARSEWRDLGVFFWPRLVRRVECERPPRTKPGAARGGDASCGWPPGRLRCATGVAKTLHLLRWHCRLRGGGEVWARLAGMLGPTKGKPPPQPPQPGRRKSRKRYRCEWLKVPYPVPADCQCGGV